MTLRHDPRRVVMGLVVDHELEMTEIRIRQLHHLVDVFVILEASITAGWIFLTNFYLTTVPNWSKLVATKWSKYSGTISMASFLGSGENRANYVE